MEYFNSLLSTVTTINQNTMFTRLNNALNKRDKAIKEALQAILGLLKNGNTDKAIELLEDFIKTIDK